MTTIAIIVIVIWLTCLTVLFFHLGLYLTRLDQATAANFEQERAVCRGLLRRVEALEARAEETAREEKVRKNDNRE